MQNQVRSFSSDFFPIMFLLSPPSGSSVITLVSTWLTDLRSKTSLLLSVSSFLQSSLLWASLTTAAAWCPTLWESPENLALGPRPAQRNGWVTVTNPLLCGISFLLRVGRYTRSLDVGRFVCAKCKGPLVLLPLTRKDGTPIKPHVRPFAKYVKLHYRLVREQMAGITHGDVMRTLSKDYFICKEKKKLWGYVRGYLCEPSPLLWRSFRKISLFL